MNKDFADKEKKNEGGRVVRCSHQYIKDLSVEVFDSPNIFLESAKKPKLDIMINVNAVKIEGYDNKFEVVLSLNIEAKTEDDGKKILLIELFYAGLFSLELPKQELEATLLIFCPSLLFPYARRIISDQSREAGFTPILLEPVDFGKLYLQKKQISAKQKGNQEKNQQENLAENQEAKQVAEQAEGYQEERQQEQQ